MLTYAAARTDLFISAKTETAIPARSSIIRDALVQSSLDPNVRAIQFVTTAAVGATQVAVGAIVIVRDDGSFYLDVVGARPERDPGSHDMVAMALDGLGLAPLTLTTADIRSEPRFANARAVWHHRLHPVGIELRMRILTALQDDGPMSVGCLLRQVRAARDPAPAVMALACSDLIELDLVTRPLGPSTIARSRS